MNFSGIDTDTTFTPQHFKLFRGIQVDDPFEETILQKVVSASVNVLEDEDGLFLRFMCVGEFKQDGHTLKETFILWIYEDGEAYFTDVGDRDGHDYRVTPEQCEPLLQRLGV